jgi:hypothetical protein
VALPATDTAAPAAPRSIPGGLPFVLLGIALLAIGALRRRRAVD